jgi:hypothetical protein
VRDLSTKVRKESQFKQKILTDISALESVERRWLAGILAGMAVGAIDVILFLPHLWEILNGQPIIIPLIAFAVVVTSAAVLLIMSLAAFGEYFSLSLSLRVNVGRGMVIKKRGSRSAMKNMEKDEGLDRPE